MLKLNKTSAEKLLVIFFYCARKLLYVFVTWPCRLVAYSFCTVWTSLRRITFCLKILLE